MAALDFPSTGLVHGQVDASGNYFWDSSISAWRSNGTTSAMGPRVTALEIANASTNKSGLVPVVPSSIVVGSGSASADLSGGVTFSGVSWIALNNVFTSTYRNYKVLIGHNGGSTDGTELRFQFRSAGTNTSSGYYYSGWRTNAIDGGNGIWYANNTSSIHYGYDRATATTHSFTSMDVGAPQVSGQTTFNLQSVSYSGSAFANITNSGVASADASHDGITLIYNSGTHSGFVKVLGYN